MSNNNMATLQAHLFDVLQDVKSGAIDVERANAVCAVSQQLINTVKAESDFGHRTGQAVASSMIEVKAPSPTAIAAATAAAAAKPKAIEGVTIERRANGAVIMRRRKAHPNIADMMKAFGCIDAMLARLAEGWIHELQGAAVFRNPQDGVWYEIPAAMEGWIALWERLGARYDLLRDLDPARKIVARLRYGTPIPPELVARCQEVVDQCKRAYRRMDVFEIGSVVKTQLIANAAEAAGLTETHA